MIYQSCTVFLFLNLKRANHSHKLQTLQAAGVVFGLMVLMKYLNMMPVATMCHHVYLAIILKAQHEQH